MRTVVLAPTASRPAHGVAMILTAGTLFALNGTVSKLLLRAGFDPPQLTTFRATGSFLGLLLLSLLIQPGRHRLRRRRQELPLLIAFGCAGFFFVPMLYFVAIGRLPVGIGLLFQFTGPAFVALWARFGQHAPVRRRLWLGLVLCLGGLFCVAQVWAGELTLDPLGVLAGLTSAILLAVYFVIGSRFVRDADALSVTCWAFGVAAAVGAMVRPWWRFPVELVGTSSGGVPHWLLLGYLLIFGTTLSYLLVAASMRHLPPTSVGIIGMVEPVLASVFAWLLLAEILSTAQILGGLVVLAGVVLAETARTPEPAVPPEPAEPAVPPEPAEPAVPPEPAEPAVPPVPTHTPRSPWPERRA